MTFSNKILTYIHSHLVLEDLLEISAEHLPNTIALQLWQDQGITQRISFRSLLEAVRREGKRLKQIGLEKGMRVVLIEENSIDWVIAFFAILHCQATAVLIDPRLSQQDYLNLISISDPQLLILGHKYYTKITKLTPLPSVAIENQIFQIPPLATPIKAVFDGDPSLAVFIFTSGTTGNFKAVMLDHQALLYATKSGVEFLKGCLGQHALAILPLTHVYGLVSNLIIPLAAGMTVTFLDKLQGEVVLKAMEATQTHNLPAVPRIINLFAMRIQQEIDKKSPKVSHFLKRLIDLCYQLRVKTGLNLGRFLFYSIHKKFGGHLKAMISGGSSSDKNLVQFMEGLGFVILEGYGLSETSGITCCQTIRDKLKTGSVGAPSPWMNIQIVKAQPDQKEGEILIKGPSVMRGYFRDPIQTEQVLKNGWFYTGDLGYIDDEGTVYITGRIKEIIVTATGQKAMPLDVERRYQDIPGVEELAVFGVPTPPSLAEDIHAAVIVKKETLKHLGSEKERYAFIVEKIAKRSETIPTHLRITQVHLVDSIPKTTTLKVKRKELSRLFAISIESSKPPTLEPLAPSASKDSSIELIEKRDISSMPLQERIEEDVGPRIIHLVQKVCELTKKKLDKPLDRSTNFQIDLKFDSLEALELVFAIEKEFKIRFSHNLNEIHTIGDLQDALVSYLQVQHQVSDAPPSPSLSHVPSPSVISEKIEIVAESLEQKNVASSIEQENTPVDISSIAENLEDIERQIITITKAIALLNKKNLTKEITSDTNFQMDLAFDSLLSLDLIFEIEKQFKTSLKDLPIDRIHTIRDLAEFVHKNKTHVGSSAPAPQMNLHEIFWARAKESSPSPLPKQNQTKTIINRIIETLYRSYFSLTSIGNASLPPEPYILCANHCSHLDTLALILATGSSIDSFVALAAKDYFFEGSKYRHWLTTLFNIVPFDRDTHRDAIVDNLILCKHILEEKKNVILFPEGTRSVSGQLQPFKSFVGILGVELRYPIVPAFIQGTFDLMPKNKSFPKPGKIKVAFGSPILAESYEKKMDLQGTVLYQKVTQEVYYQIQELSKKFQGKSHD